MTSDKLPTRFEALGGVVPDNIPREERRTYLSSRVVDAIGDVASPKETPEVAERGPENPEEDPKLEARLSGFSIPVRVRKPDGSIAEGTIYPGTKEVTSDEGGTSVLPGANLLVEDWEQPGKTSVIFGTAVRDGQFFPLAEDPLAGNREAIEVDQGLTVIPGEPGTFREVHYMFEPGQV